MAYEVTIICDECAGIVVAAQTATKARAEGKRDGVLHRLRNQELCTDCYERKKPRKLAAERNPQ